MSAVDRLNLDSRNDMYLDPYIQQITNKEKITIKKKSKMSDS